MAKDQFHIEMEDISMYPLERSADYYFWEEISFIELNENILIKLSNEKLKILGISGKISSMGKVVPLILLVLIQLSLKLNLLVS